LRALTVDYLTHLQWPAMAVTVLSTFLVGSTDEHRRRIGFWLFLFSNVLWTVWGVYDGAPALVALQVALAFMNVRGARKAAAQEAKQASESSSSDGQHSSSTKPQSAGTSIAGEKHA
jgi:hypothetical protein